MLKDQDRIFKNLYNDMGSDVISSQKRGDWVNTKEITDKDGMQDNLNVSIRSHEFVKFLRYEAY